MDQIQKRLFLRKLAALRQLERQNARNLDDGRWEWISADIEEFIEGKLFLNLKGQIRAAVKQDICDFYESGKNEAIFIEAIGNGKSFKASIICCYEAHLLLCLRNPQRTLGLAGSSRLAVMNMSVDGDQAKDVVFGEIKAKIDSSYWFQSRYRPDPRVNSRLRFAKNIHIIPGNSRETKPLGYNIVCAVLDEAAWFIQNKNVDRAEEISLALSRRMRSRVAKRWAWKLVTITSPRYEQDHAEIQFRDPDVFKRRRTAWDGRPDDFKDDKRVDWMDPEGEKWSIPETLLKDAIKKPIHFLRDFCAKAARALMPYIPDRLAILRAVDSSRCRFVETGPLPDDLRGDPRNSYAVHVDLAKSKDSCGVAIGHREGPDVIIDFVWRITPTKGTEVNFATVRSSVIGLRQRGFRLLKVSYDGWQSVDSIQQIEAKGIEVEELSVDRTLEPYDTMKELLCDEPGHLKIPQFEVLLTELRNLEIIEAKKVDHPPKGSKDCADAVAGVCYHLRSMTPTTPGAVLIKTGQARVGRRGPVGAGRFGDRSRY